MTDASFKFRVITPLKITEQDIRHIRLKDETGFFGIMRGHTDFLTVLEPSLCYFTDTGGREVFLAVDGGILSVREGIVCLTSREVYESTDAERIGGIIETTILRRDESEIVLRGAIEGIERSFMEKSIALMKKRL
jgi:F-type H+-transporting ATPase subunit epsilon